MYTCKKPDQCLKQLPFSKNLEDDKSRVEAFLQHCKDRPVDSLHVFSLHDCLQILFYVACFLYEGIQLKLCYIPAPSLMKCENEKKYNCILAHIKLQLTDSV